MAVVPINILKYFMKNNKTNREKFRAAIIGAGQIGAFYDSPESKDILTHAHAYRSHPDFELAGFVDIDKKKSKSAAKIWGTKAYSCLKELFNQEIIDVASICAPDASHYEIIKELKKYKIKAGIIEKPLTDNLIESKKIVNDAYIKNNFLVNYSRRYVAEYQNLAARVKKGEFGEFLHGAGLYGKGLLRNGSHLVDLLSFFGIDFNQIQIVAKFVDYLPSDPTYSILARRKDEYFFNFQAVPKKNYNIFEADLVFAKGRLKFLDNGARIEEYKIGQDLTYKADRILYLHRTYKTGLNRAIYRAVDNLYKVILGEEKPMCAVQDAFAAQKFCQSIDK